MTTSSILLAAAAAATLAIGVRTSWSPPGTTTGSEICSITDALETAALQGELTIEVVACLESKSGGSVKANRLLMINSYSAGDLPAWREHAAVEMARARRDGQVDVDIAYKVALYDSKAEDWEGVIIHVEDALPLIDVWPEDVREKRRASLYKLRAVAGTKIAEETGNPEDQMRSTDWTAQWRALDPE